MRQLQRRLQIWGIRKKLQAPESDYIVQKALERRRDQNKSSVAKVGSLAVSEKRTNRLVERRAKTAGPIGDGAPE